MSVEKPCLYCQEGQSKDIELNENFSYYNSFHVDKDNNLVCVCDGDGLHCSGKDEKIKMNYCLKCGRKLI